MVMSMPERAARAPPMYTFDDPVTISYMAEVGGTTPQHVGLIPISPQRAVFSLLMSTVALVPNRIGPVGGSGVGGTGGGPLGGCLTCACGTPKAILVNVAAGNGPSAAARLLVSLAAISSRPAGLAYSASVLTASEKPGMSLSI